MPSGVINDNKFCHNEPEFSFGANRNLLWRMGQLNKDQEFSSNTSSFSCPRQRQGALTTCLTVSVVVIINSYPMSIH